MSVNLKHGTVPDGAAYAPHQLGGCFCLNEVVPCLVKRPRLLDVVEGCGPEGSSIEGVHSLT